MSGRLHVVAVPIGNPDDITVRALQVLGQVALIAAEDTRTAQTLLRRHQLQTPLISYWDQNEAARVPSLIARLESGQDIALISEAGTPLISDPGFRIVRACIEADIPVVVVPGASAVVTALAGAGLPTDRFYFGGFLPTKAGPRREALTSVASVKATLVFYESPVRLSETLDLIASLWPERPVCVARNLTGVYEQWLRGTAQQVRVALGDETRGEVTLLIGGASDVIPADMWAQADARITALLAEGMHPRDVRDRVVAETGLPRRDVYQRILEQIN